ncbi:hypothetical protein ACIRP2_37670 [Streptomyces sp. NPDC101194]|uniref:hypothetical protein n=1 Tax=Streptomyces sp. NPDC101194 TaxID=3366127 RepID=UPI003816362F
MSSTDNPRSDGLPNQPEPTPDAQPPNQPDPTPDTQPLNQPDPTPDTQPLNQPDPTPDTQPLNQPEPGSSPGVGPDTSTGPETRQPMARRIIQTLLPDTREMSRHQSRFVLIVTVCASIAAVVLSQTWELFTNPLVKAITNAQDDSLDRKEDFSFQIRKDSPGDSGSNVLEVPFTEAETNELSSLDLSSDEGYRRYSDLLKKHKSKWVEDSADGKITQQVARYQMNLFSDRQASLSITNLTATDLTCKPTTGTAVIIQPPQGGADYKTMLFDLPGKKPPMSIGGSKSEFKKPFFHGNRVDLGANSSPAGLNIEFTSRDQDCTFTLQAEWIDSEGVHKKNIERMSVYGVPSKPRQIFIRGTVSTVRACDMKAKDPCERKECTRDMCPSTEP